jgi:hypothetical protein
MDKNMIKGDVAATEIYTSPYTERRILCAVV